MVAPSLLHRSFALAFLALMLIPGAVAAESEPNQRIFQCADDADPPGSVSDAVLKVVQDTAGDACRFAWGTYVRTCEAMTRPGHPLCHPIE